MKHLKFAWLLVVLLALAACGQDVAPDALKAVDTAAPTITSDKADYAPGELVTLTGSNWQAGESVQIVVDDDGLDVENPWKRTVTVNADDVGNITDQFNLPNKFVADYVVTATGETSGTATTTFTDANVEAKANLPSTATTKVKWVLYNTKDCTGAATNSSTGGGVNLTGSTASPLFGASKDQSLKLTADGSSSDNRAFDKWTDASGTTLAKFGNDATTTCQTGFNNGTGVVTFTANYAAAPAVTTTSVGSITASSSTFGGKTDLSATVTPKDALGKVDFYVNNSSTAMAATYNSSTGVATLSGYEHKLNAKDAAYSVKAVFTSSNTSTHTSSEATKDALTVGKAAGSVSISNIPSSATVGGTFTPTYTKAGDGTASTTSNTTSICTVTSGVVNFVAAGTCKLQASVTEGTNHLAATGAEQTFTIAAPAKQNQTIDFAQPTSPQSYNVTFNVKPTASSGLAVTVAASGVCTATPATTGYDVKMTSGTGTCTLKASQTGNGTYNAAADVTRTVEASKATATITLGNLSHTYSDSPKSATATTDPADLTGVSITYAGSATAPTDAGSYAVVATLEHPNYSAKDASGTLVIGKANQTISLATGTPTTKKYGDADFTISAKTTSGLDVSFAAKEGSTCSVSSGTVSNLRVGDCIIVASQAGNGNYNAATALEHKIVVGKAAAEISLSGLSYTYDGSAKNVTVTTKPADLNVTVTYDGSGTAPTNAGSYEVLASINDANYDAPDATGTLVIAQAEAKIVVKGYEGVYDGDPHGATGTATGVKDESLTLNLGDSFTNVPGGTAEWSFAGDGNYKAASGSVDIKISKARAIIDVKGYSGVYDGNAHGATGTATGVNGAPLTLNLGDSFTDAGTYTANWSLADGNYEGASGSVEINIAQAEQKISWPAPAAISYGTALSIAQLNASANGGGALGYSPPAGTVLVAGSHTLTVNAAATQNYKAASTTVQLTVNKADQVIDFGALGNKTFGDPSFSVSATGGASGNPVTLAASGTCTVSDTTVSITGAGSCAITASQAGNDNYNAAKSVEQGFTIAKANATVKVTGGTYTYDGTAKSATGTATGIKGETLSGLTLGNSFTDVPGGKADWSFAGDKNYNSDSGSVSIVINPAPATVTLSNLSYIFDGAAKSATVSTQPAGLSVSTTYNGSSGAPSDVGSYSVVATINNANYQGSASGTLTISAWKLQGFYSPVDMGGTLNNAKAGSTVPLKFEVFAGSTELTSTSVISTFTQKLSCAAGTGDDIEQYATGSTSLRFDTTAGQFIFNWQTPRAAGSCYRVTMTTKDGSSISADFRLR